MSTEEAVVGVMPARGVLLDLDGTILETVGDLATATNRTLADFKREAVSEERVRTWIGDGVRALVRFALEATGGCDDALLDDAHERFMVHYGDCFADRSHPFPGVVEALDHLRESGISLAVVTNKAAAFTEPLLEATGLSARLDVIISGDSVARKKPDPAPIRAALERMGLEADQAVLVGDSRNDVEAGLAAGCRVVCVTYGYNRGEDVSTLGAQRLVDSFSAVRDLIQPGDRAVESA
ncbi:phosphoglycolate phosphatase [Thiohalorhabdus methylotrophus]|uniref:Phosphoglycolate phosphatase n=1 Tax=Thiohalorhabdus methylotrophus TaxID=3242694 RepID=A0ABV4TQ79_9GAMM